MATYTYPSVTPNEMSIELVSNTAIFESPLTGSIQTIDRSGERLMVTLVHRGLATVNKGLLFGFFARLNGQQHRVTLPYHALDNQGAFGGTPLVNGASQTGNSLVVDGASNNITNWIKAGDVFSFGDGLKICTVDANSDGSGNVTISFSPRIRTSPANDTAVETTAPTGTFLLMDNTVGFSMQPGKFGSITVRLIEDIT